MLKRTCRRTPTTCGVSTCGVRRRYDGFVHTPHAPRRTLFSVFSLSERMSPELLANPGMLPPQKIAHAKRRQAVADRHVPPGEVAQQRFGQQRDQDIEAHLEETESDDDEEERGRGVFD